MKFVEIWFVSLKITNRMILQFTTVSQGVLKTVEIVFGLGSMVNGIRLECTSPSYIIHINLFFFSLERQRRQSGHECDGGWNEPSYDRAKWP